MRFIESARVYVYIPLQVTYELCLEQVTFTPCFIVPWEAVDVRLTWIDHDEAGDYVVPNVLNLRDLVSRPDNMDETVLHT